MQSRSAGNCRRRLVILVLSGHRRCSGPGTSRDADQIRSETAYHHLFTHSLRKLVRVRKQRGSRLHHKAGGSTVRFRYGEDDQVGELGVGREPEEQASVCDGPGAQHGEHRSQSLHRRERLAVYLVQQRADHRSVTSASRWSAHRRTGGPSVDGIDPGEKGPVYLLQLLHGKEAVLVQQSHARGGGPTPTSTGGTRHGGE